MMGKRMTKRLSIIVVEKDRERALAIVDGLREAGHHEVQVIADEFGLAQNIAERNPDLVLIDAGRHRGAGPSQYAAAAPRGNVRRRKRRGVDQTSEAGVSAYVVAGLSARCIKPVLEALREAKGERTAQLLDHLKKGEMATEAEVLLNGSGWLPEVLRRADLASSDGEAIGEG